MASYEIGSGGSIPTEAESHPKLNPINPDYYDKQSEYQPRFVAKRWGLDPYLFNALKYICRAGKKESDKEVQDLQKACQYIQFRIEELQGK